MDLYAFPTITSAAFWKGGLSPDTITKINMEYSESGKSVLYEYAKERKILPFVATLLTELYIDQAFWSEIVLQYAERNSIVLEQLDKAFSEIEKLGVRKIFLSENFGALLSTDGNIARFASGDVDIYADITEKSKITSAFKNLGYEVTERYAGRKLTTTMFRNTSVLPEGFMFDINWEPLSRLKLPCLINADDFIDWSALRKYKHTNIVLPPPEALLYICLLHISIHSFSRAPDIRLYEDIANCSNTDPDWEAVLNFAQSDRTLIRTLTATKLASLLLDVSLPPSVELAIQKRSRSVSRILKLVYNAENNFLTVPSGRVELVKIEAFCDDKSVRNGIKNIIFPDLEWLMETYSNPEEHALTVRIKHFIRMFLK